VAAVYLLRKAWTTNFGGIRDAVMASGTGLARVSGDQGAGHLRQRGVGQMSAELAGKLEAAGLMGSS
jgi:hypothetical protein